MFILSSCKTKREVPFTWILIIIMINLALLGGPVEALKCYYCSCWSNCVRQKNLFREKECPSHENACVTRYPTHKSVDYISKDCYPKSDGATEQRDMESGTRIYKYCYTDLCNDAEAGGITNPNPANHRNSDSANVGAGAVVRGKIASWSVPNSMIMAYVGRRLMN